MNLLLASITSSVLILVIVVIRSLTKHLLPKTMFLVLWFIAVIKLLLPYSVTSVFSIYNIVVLPGMNSVFQLKSFSSTSAGDIVTLISLLATETGSKTSADPLFIVWICGAVLSGTFFLGTLIRCRRIIREALPVADSGKIAGWRHTQRLRRDLLILTSDKLATPIATGIIRPKIILPKLLGINDDALLTHVLTHELIHIKKWHAVWKFLLIAVLCLHWFNPIVWLMYKLVSSDLEHSCDEQVIKELGSDIKTGYALSLLGMARLQKKPVPAVSSGFVKNSAEQRILSVMKYRKASHIAVLAGSILVVTITLTFATMSNSKFERALTIGVEDEGAKIFSGAVYLGTPCRPYYYADTLPTLYGVVQNSMFGG